MMRVYKYVLPNLEYNDIEMPLGAEILSVQMQGVVLKSVCMWAKVNTGKKSTVVRRFYVTGTGWDLPTVVLNFIGTVQDGGLVWHVFEDNTPKPL